MPIQTNLHLLLTDPAFKKHLLHDLSSGNLVFGSNFLEGMKLVVDNSLPPDEVIIKGDTLMATSPTMAVLKKGQTAEKTGEVIHEDVILDTVEQLENLSKNDTLALAHALVEDAGLNYFKMGGALARIQEEGWWDNGTYGSFKEYLLAEFNMGIAKASYLVKIYTNLVNSGISWEAVKSVGWTKLREIVDLLTEENVAKWVELATQEGMTTVQLIEHVKEAKSSGNGDKPDAPEPDSDNKVTTKTFKLHADQLETVTTALEKAKEEGDTEFDTVALDYICMRFLSDDLGKAKKPSMTKTLVKATPFEKTWKLLKETHPEECAATEGHAAGEGGEAPTLPDLMKAAGADAVLDIFGDMFPEYDISVGVPD